MEQDESLCASGCRRTLPGRTVRESRVLNSTASHDSHARRHGPPFLSLIESFSYDEHKLNSPDAFIDGFSGRNMESDNQAGIVRIMGKQRLQPAFMSW